MLYKNEDEFLKILANKISKLNPRQPSINDWADFEMAYSKHKNKKWLLAIWFGLFTMSCIGVFCLINNQKVSAEKAIEYNYVKVTPQNKATTSNNSKKMTVNTPTEAQNSKQNIIKNHNISDSKNKSKLNERLKNTLHEKKPLNANLQMEELDKFNSNEQDAKYNSSLQYAIDRRKPKSFLLSNPINKNIINTKLTINSIDSIKMNTLGATTKSSPIAKYFELGLCIQNNNFTQLDYPSDQFFKGVGFNAGMRLQNNLSFNLGINIMYLDQVKINKFSFQTEEHQIERIDTTIKYNINYNRLMMQFDTVMSYKNINHESRSVYKNNILYISIPLQARYYIGNDKHSMYGSFGVIGTLIYQSHSLEKNVGLANETSQTTTDYSFLFAPTIGLGFHQRIYKDWAFHLASNYSNYLNSNLNQSNTFQFQTGIKYNF
jgi:hypothetical protein